MEKRSFILSPEEQERVRRIGREVNERAGIFGPPTITAEQLQERMRSKGIKPEDLIFTRELMRQRYGDEDAK